MDRVLDGPHDVFVRVDVCPRPDVPVEGLPRLSDVGVGEHVSTDAIRDVSSVLVCKHLAPDHLSAADREAFADENRRNIAYCIGRYVFTDPDVRQARETLSENVRARTDIDPYEHVVETVQNTIHRYVDEFNLDG